MFEAAFEAGQGQHGALGLRSIRDSQSFLESRTEWSELLSRSTASVFNSWEWLYPWHRRIAPDWELMILEARDPDGLLVGLVPLALHTVSTAGVSIRRLCFLGETHVGSDYLDVVAAPERRLEVTAAFARAIREARTQWDVLELNDLHIDSPTIPVLREVFGTEEFRHRLVERFICPFETFRDGETFEVFLKRTARRDNFLRRRKWLQRQAGFDLNRVDSPDGLERAMNDFFLLHRRRWEADGGSSGIRGPAVEVFHRDAARLLAEKGLLRMYTARLGDRPLASVYGIVHRDKFIYYQSGYDPEWASKSVGLVLVGEAFRDALESGLTEFDFLRGTEAYKADWTTQERRTVGVRIWSSGGKGDWLARTEELSDFARQVAKTVLPKPWVETIRRIRRRRSRLH